MFFCEVVLMQCTDSLGKHNYVTLYMWHHVAGIKGSVLVNAVWMGAFGGVIWYNITIHSGA